MLSIDEEARKRFEADWLNGRSLSIKEYLPEKSKSEVEQTTYLGTLEELVCIDLEFRWRSGEAQDVSADQTVEVQQSHVPTRVEDYLREFPELEEEGILSRLIEQEIHVRKTAGYVVDAGEYKARFPSVRIDESLFEGTQGDGQPGEIVEEFPREFGPYVLRGLLGRGGMGSVYKAEQPQAGRYVALKVAELASVPANARAMICQRFQTEAHAAAGLVHDHAVPIFDVGVLDGQPYYAMRMVDGGDLGQRSKQNPLPPKDAARYMLGIARCMGKAHGLGMLHRDIKPQNILVETQSDRALLTDFGLARFADDQAGVTQTGQLLGTPSFMPPEQIRNSSEIDGRADIYSLGATLYQLLTGKPPFRAAEVAETLRQVTHEDPLAPQTIDRSIDKDLDTICLKCLEKEPDARYQTADELADDLEAFLEGKPITARPVGRTRKLWKWSRRNPELATAVGGAVAATLFALIACVVGLVAVRNENARTHKTLRMSLAGLSDLSQKIQADDALSAPEMSPSQREFLASIFATHSNLVVLFEDNPSAKAQLALSQVEVAKLDIELNGVSAESEAQIKDALATLETLTQEEADRTEVVYARSEAYQQLSMLEKDQQLNEEALKSTQQVALLRQQLIGQLEKENSPLDRVVEAKRKLANSRMNEGLLLLRLSKPEASRRLLVQADTMRAALLDESLLSKVAQPLQYRILRDQAKQAYNVAFLELSQQKYAEARDGFARAKGLFDSLLELSRTDKRNYEQRARSMFMLANLQDYDEAGSEIAEALVTEAGADLLALTQLSGIEDAGYRIRLLQLYQNGIQVLIDRRLMVTEDTLAEFEAQFQSLQEQELDPTLQSAETVLDLRRQTQQVFVAYLLDSQLNPASVLAAAQNASAALSSAPELQNDRQLQKDLGGLQAIIREMQETAQVPTSDNL